MIDIRLTSWFGDSSQRRPYAKFELCTGYEDHIRSGVKAILTNKWFGDRKSISSRIMMSFIVSSTSIGASSALRTIPSDGASEKAAELEDILTSPSRANERLSYFAEACQLYPDQFFDTEEDWRAHQAAKIHDKIEVNCQGLVQRILENGGKTFWSNGFGGGYKGVYWKRDGVTYFTSLANGSTYGHCELVAAGETEAIEPETFFLNEDMVVDPGFDVLDVVPETAVPGLPIENF